MKLGRPLRTDVRSYPYDDVVQVIDQLDIFSWSVWTGQKRQLLRLLVPVTDAIISAAFKGKNYGVG